MNIERWAAGLWRFVESNLVDGRPFFLCIDDLALQSIAREMSVEFGSAKAAEEDFLCACLTRIDVSGNRALIDPSSFGQTNDAHSLAICFAVQQVLAAERMIDDNDGSRDAYYVRYRQVLGMEPHGVGSPLPYQQFSRVWDTYKEELLAVTLAGDSSITFRAGTGKNKYRAFPMSQALLDLESLRIVHERVRGIDKLSDEHLIHSVRRISRHLSKKCRDKVYVEAIRSALVNQIRSFVYSEIQRPVLEADKGQRETVDPSSFFIYIEDDGWDDVYRLGIREADSDQDVTDSLSKALHAYLGRRRYLGFKEGVMSDFEGMSKEPEDLNDLALIVVEENASLLTEPDWLRYFEQVEHCAVPNGYRMLLRRHSIPAPTAQPLEANRRQSIEFLEGVILDRTRQEFLVSFPPSAILCGGERLSEDVEIRVNGEKTTVARFLEGLAASLGVIDFQIVFGDSEGYLSMVTTRDKTGVDIGYPIQDGYCSATAQQIEDEDAIRYLNIPERTAVTAGIDRRLRRGELLKHLSLCDAQWVPVVDEVIESIVTTLERELPASSFRERHICSIRRKRMVPVTLLKLYNTAVREID